MAHVPLRCDVLSLTVETVDVVGIHIVRAFTVETGVEDNARVVKCRDVCVAIPAFVGRVGRSCGCNPLLILALDTHMMIHAPEPWAQVHRRN